MGDIKTKYPATGSTPLTLTLAGLSADSNLLAGRASAAVDNTANLDIDHLVSGVITVGTSPVANSSVEVWAWAPYRTSAGAPTYPDGITGTDAAKTVTASGVKYSALRMITTITVDGTSNRTYPFAPVSIAALFGAMPKFWGIFIVHNTGVNLNSIASTQDIEYERIQAQTV